MHSVRDLTAQLVDLGVQRGGVLVVHSAFSRIRPVEGGPAGLIKALQSAVGPDGTLVMPSMSDEDDRVFDVRETPCLSLGIVPETFRQSPGVLRSDNPHAFAARGPQATFITEPHALDVPHGPGSPVDRVHDLDGQVLLLGIGHDANTTVHLAENLAEVRYRIPHYVTVATGRVDYDEVDHCCENFALMDAWLGPLQQRGRVGNAEARLMRSRDVVRVALEHLRENETVFLHPRGVCEECDLARLSL